MRGVKLSDGYLESDPNARKNLKDITKRNVDTYRIWQYSI